jgi:tRNA(His) guanylyltransferase
MSGTQKLDLGNRMKRYEEATTNIKLIPGLPWVARLDGRAFHTLLRKCDKPFDNDVHRMMLGITVLLTKQFNCKIAYTQSDEITMVFGGEQELFDGRVFKLQSIFAASASSMLATTISLFGVLQSKLSFDYDQPPAFDCRVFNVPSEQEAVNCLLWREQDATKNSINQAAQAVFSHGELQNNNGKQLQEMLFSKGINWNDYPDWCKRGSYVGRVKWSREWTDEEFDALPPMHNARKLGRDFKYERTMIERLDMPPMVKITNRADVVFRGAQPQLQQEPSDEGETSV